MFEWLKDLLAIYIWKEFWIVMSVPTAIVRIWALFFSYLPSPTTFRTVAIWSIIFALTLGAATVDALKKQLSKA